MTVPVEVVGICSNMDPGGVCEQTEFYRENDHYDNMIDSKYHYMLKGNQRIQKIAKRPEIPA